MSDIYLGEIRMFGGNFAIQNWAFCNGQIMSIAQNSALFALIGTTYGGDGITTFALPDLRGRLPENQGQGPGLPPVVLGERAGVEYVTLTPSNLPSHTHSLNATLTDVSSPSINGNVLPGKPTSGADPFFYTAPGTPSPNMVMLPPTACAISGGNQPHSNMMPSLCVTFIIALQGIFPSRI
jgi:microcystin-dependent protein